MSEQQDHTNESSSSLCGLNLLTTQQLETLLQLYILMEEEQCSPELVSLNYCSILEDSLWNTESCCICSPKDASPPVNKNITSQPLYKYEIATRSSITSRDDNVMEQPKQIKPILFTSHTMESMRQEQEFKKTQPKRPRGRPRKPGFDMHKND